MKLNDRDMYGFFMLTSFTKLNAQEALIEKSISTYQVDVNAGPPHFILVGGFIRAYNKSLVGTPFNSMSR